MSFSGTFTNGHPHRLLKTTRQRISHEASAVPGSRFCLRAHRFSSLFGDWRVYSFTLRLYAAATAAAL